MMSSVSGGGYTAGAFYSHIAALAPFDEQQHSQRAQKSKKKSNAKNNNDNDDDDDEKGMLRRIKSATRDSILSDALDNLHKQMQANCNYIGRKHAGWYIAARIILGAFVGNLMLFVTTLVPMAVLVRRWFWVVFLFFI
jgi:hypothetical protein